MPFNINNCQMLQVGSRNMKNDNEMRGVKIKNVHSVKDLGVTVMSNLKFSQQCNESIFKGNRLMGLIKVFSRIKMYYPYIIVLSDPSWSMQCNFGLPTMQKTLLN